MAQSTAMSLSIWSLVWNTDSSFRLKTRLVFSAPTQQSSGWFQVHYHLLLAFPRGYRKVVTKYRLLGPLPLTTEARQLFNTSFTLRTPMTTQFFRRVWSTRPTSVSTSTKEFNQEWSTLFLCKLTTSTPLSTTWTHRPLGAQWVLSTHPTYLRRHHIWTSKTELVQTRPFSGVCWQIPTQRATAQLRRITYSGSMIARAHR